MLANDARAMSVAHPNRGSRTGPGALCRGLGTTGSGRIPERPCEGALLQGQGGFGRSMKPPTSGAIDGVDAASGSKRRRHLYAGNRHQKQDKT